jgi:NTE family protein
MANTIGMMLTGGGARGSYQAGALLALGEILERSNFHKDKRIPYWSGVSAGAINSSYCVAGLDSLTAATQQLAEIWSDLTPSHVYKTDLFAMAKNSSRWIRDLTLGPLMKNTTARSLLDTTPLMGLLQNIRFERIEKMIQSGLLGAASVSAYSYRDNKTVTFIQTDQDISWQKTRRYSKNVKLSKDHVMASCAIPVLFPAYPIDNEYFGDGAFRSITPLSPLIIKGANKILLVGVRGKDEVIGRRADHIAPSIAKMSGVILNSLFFDTIEVDVQRIGRVNEILEAVQGEVVTERSDYSLVDVKVLRPSQDVSRIASEKAQAGLPRTVDYLMGGLGTRQETAELASYILFEPSFTRYLIDLGYKDTMEKKDELSDWFNT